METFHQPPVGCTPQEGWDPAGQSRQQETLAHMGVMAKAMPVEVRDETMRNVTLNASFQKKFLKCFFVPEEDTALLHKMQGAQ